MSFRILFLWGVMFVFLTGSATARQQNDGALVRSWARSQQQAISEYSAFSVDATVHHTVKTGGGTNEAEIKMRFSGNPDQPGGRPDILSFVLNGETLDPTESRRLQQGLSSMMSQEIGPLLYNFTTPFHFLRRLQPIGGPQSEMVSGEELLRYTFKTRGGPGGPEGLRGDGRPPQRTGPPNGRRPGFGQGRPLPEGGPEERVSLWFNPKTERLIMSVSRLSLPGNRELEVRSRYEQVRGIDVPVFRTIKGSFPMQRRLRTTTVQLDHETAYVNYSFSK